MMHACTSKGATPRGGTGAASRSLPRRQCPGNGPLPAVRGVSSCCHASGGGSLRLLTAADRSTMCAALLCRAASAHAVWLSQGPDQAGGHPFHHTGRWLATEPGDAWARGAFSGVPGTAIRAAAQGHQCFGGANPSLLHADVASACCLATCFGFPELETWMR